MPRYFIISCKTPSYHGSMPMKRSTMAIPVEPTSPELNFTDWLIPQSSSGFIRGLQINESLTLDKFTFRGTKNQLTGVPEQVVVSGVQLKLPQSLYLFVEHNYTSRIPLNDANTTFASSYNLLQAKAGWQHAIGRKNYFEIYAGADNILNQKYSLGNDLNAVGN